MKIKKRDMLKVIMSKKFKKAIDRSFQQCEKSCEQLRKARDIDQGILNRPMTI